MESIIGELLQQHRDAEGMLARLGAGVGRVRHRAGLGAEVMSELAELRRDIQGEVMRHFREEEQALFPVLGRHLDTSSGPIAMLMEEHARFRQLELEFEEALAALESGYADGWEAKLCQAGDAIGELLPPHIEKEETVLFPMAEQMMGPDEWAEVKSLWIQAQAAASAG